ncbi:CRS2-like protein, chloroplastic [Apostasia shenzhenica]|uniref:CRS2-like protein, chloroplastic n=1 Tax=Apostasia shenzhenica TaxID=1088818 RepID=A0A2I0ART6_9ASPA|nr:CRS2-like protein, chloroplastic [Apostasia shenzhenica]
MSPRTAISIETHENPRASAVTLTWASYPSGGFCASAMKVLPGGGPSELPATGQYLVKVIGNLCFSLFFIFVLVFSIIALTYHPPDPWLQSSKALVNSLSDILPNSTFFIDDSILPTGEDLVASPPSTASEEIIPDKSFIPSCDPSVPLNCSHPAILAAIQRFNSKTFRRSIIFLSYDIPVPGSKPSECDASWRFRNHHEKSWRRYRDYRRFRLAPFDNCTFEVVGAGKFRSGINAALVPRRPSGPDRPATRTSDAEINDTIPTVVSESEFRKVRYLYYSRGGDYCKGMNHYLWSFLCGLGEAMFLNRTFVIDLSICLAGTYTSSGKDEDGKDFRFYFDFEHLKESASLVEEREFLMHWRQWDRISRNGRKADERITVRKVPTYKISPMLLKKDKSTIIWRQFDGPEPENYWYRVCEGRAAKHIERPWHALWKSKLLMNIVSEIAGRMDWDYDAVHVVRGEKAMKKELWPNLDWDTSPDLLVEKLTKMVKPWRNLYIATNEPFYNHFDKLRSHYKVHLLGDYNEMWGNVSEWHNETVLLNGGNPVEFDGYMRVAVDTELFYRAKLQVETFNNLTRDCKDGIHTCSRVLEASACPCPPTAASVGSLAPLQPVDGDLPTALDTDSGEQLASSTSASSFHLSSAAKHFPNVILTVKLSDDTLPQCLPASALYRPLLPSSGRVAAVALHWAWQSWGKVGFDMIDVFARSLGLPMTSLFFKAQFGEGLVDGTHVLLAKPQTYMNLSGECIYVALEEGVEILKTLLTKGLTECAKSANAEQKYKHLRVQTLPT